MKASIHVSVVLFFLFLNFSCKKEAETKLPPSVEAGLNQVIQLPSSLTLSGVASTKNGLIKGYLWSLVSGPNVPVIHSPSSSITTVTDLSVGKYIFQLKAVDESGLVGIDTTSVLVTSATAHVSNLFIESTSNWRHVTFINGTDGSTHDIDLNCASWTSGGGAVYNRGFFKFSLSPIPIGSKIISAKLSLFSNPNPINGNLSTANSGSNNAFYIRRVSSSWDGNTINWNTQPSSTSLNQVLVPHTNLSFLDVVDLDVTQLVKDMISNGGYGFLMQLQSESGFNIRQFCSPNHSNTLKQPKLIVTYQ